MGRGNRRGGVDIVVEGGEEESGLRVGERGGVVEIVLATLVSDFDDGSGGCS